MKKTCPVKQWFAAYAAFEDFPVALLQ